MTVELKQVLTSGKGLVYALVKTAQADPREAPLTRPYNCGTMKFGLPKTIIYTILHLNNNMATKFENK